MTSETRLQDDRLLSIKSSLLSCQTLGQLRSAIVNAPFEDRLLTTTYDLGIIVLLCLNEKEQSIDRVALSETEHAKGSTSMTAVPFSQIRIPINDPENCIAEALRTGENQLVEDWYYLFTPALTPEQARRNQVGAAIDCSLVCPLGSGDGALIFSFYQPKEFIGDQHLSFAKQYSRVVDELMNKQF